jgi:hypothetical protein
VSRGWTAQRVMVQCRIVWTVIEGGVARGWVSIGRKVEVVRGREMKVRQRGD